MSYRAGHVALIGKPNVGKSTLLNRIVGAKVSIVSNKPQTTRKRVLGINTTPEYQIAFMDTPGIHEPHTRLGRAMVDQARGALGSVDVVLAVVDAAHHPGEMDDRIAEMLRVYRETMGAEAPPILLCMNRMDELKADNVQRNVDAFSERFQPEEYMMTTATRGVNVDKLVELIVSRLPERAAIYPDDEFTDQSSRFMAAEYVREKILRATRDEVPHSVAVTVDDWEDDGEHLTINATILVDKTSQRGILIGKQGAFLKKIGTESRLEIEELLGKKVFLQLHVKVSEGWRQNPRLLHELNYSE